jgi:hypothetical protein
MQLFEAFGIRMRSHSYHHRACEIISRRYRDLDRDRIGELKLSVTAGEMPCTVCVTVVLNGSPWKFAVELNCYVEKPDAFGSEWMLNFQITPVVKNVFANWFGCLRSSTVSLNRVIDSSTLSLLKKIRFRVSVLRFQKRKAQRPDTALTNGFDLHSWSV